MSAEIERVISDFLVRLPGGIGGKRLLAALSGGSDSVALVALLSGLSGKLGFHLEAMTVQHGLRDDGTSEADADFAVSLCASLIPPVCCARVDLEPGAVPLEAERRGGGLEDAARALRYAALRKRAAQCEADWILTGHTRNDALETALMRFLQGSGGSSLAGIQSVRDDLARPLLGLEKAELEAYLRTRGLSWREDPTNDDPRYLRNRVRSALVPLLDASFPGWKTGVLAAASRAALDESFCRSSLAFEWTVREDGVTGDRGRFEALHPALAHRALRDALNLLAVGRRVPYGYLARIVGARAVVKASVCGSGLRFEGRGDLVFFGPDIVHYDKSGYLVCVDFPGSFDLPFGHVEVSGTRDAAYIDGDFGPWRLPLTLRSRVPGDRTEDRRGTQGSLKKTFNEWAVPESLRDGIPLVEKDGELRAVFGRPFGYPDRIL